MNDKPEKTYIPLNDPSAFQRRLKSRQRVIQSFEARANASRNLSEKIADYLTAHLGSMTFLIGNSVWFAIWLVINTGLVPAIPPFDPFPFGFLTVVVSLEAIFLATIVLISQNRAAKIDDLRAEVELQINTIAEEEITKMIELQVLLLKKNGVDVSKDRELELMLEPVDTAIIEKSLEKQFK
jgi:uncharacterized membrane protein